jgi:hypothetical protein
LPCITGICTPSIRCLCNSSLSILACIGKVFACCLHQEHKRLPIVQTLTVSALSFIWEHFFSLHLLSHYSTSLDPTGTPAQSPCALVQFLFSRFLPIPCLCLTAAHPVITPIQVKIGCQYLSPYCISLPLSGSWTYGTQLFLCVVVLLVFNRFITNCCIYENSTVWIILPLSKFPGKIGGVTLVPLKTQSPRQNFLGHIYPSYWLSVYITIC